MNPFAESLLSAAREACRAPQGPERLQAAREALSWLEAAWRRTWLALRQGAPPLWQAPIEGRSPAFKPLLLELLGRGEVRILVDGGRVRAEETGVPGLWRLQEDGRELLAAAPLPQAVLEAADRGLSGIEEPPGRPGGLLAAPAILAELRRGLKALEAGAAGPPDPVELSRQPLSPADKAWLDAVLGRGGIELQIMGLARSEILQTRIRHLWRSRIFSHGGQLLLESLAACRIPPEIPCAQEDMPAALEQLSRLIVQARRLAFRLDASPIIPAHEGEAP